MFAIFESSERRQADRIEVRRLFDKYGPETVDVLKRRADRKTLSSRERRHWQRLLRKARAEHKNAMERISSRRATA